MSFAYFNEYFGSINQAVNRVDTNELEKIAELIKTISKNSMKIILAGNGGSAAMASHVSVDLTKAAGVRAINFNEADLITCFANDYGYENWVKEALVAYGDSGDLLILISSSGNSLNMQNAALQGREMGLTVVTFSGFKEENPLRKLGDFNFWVDSIDYNLVEMTHHIWLLAIVDYYIKENKALK